jgi:antirestriction protein ArdC
MESNTFYSENHAMEELTAEIGASYLNSYTGNPTKNLKNNAAYIKGWLEILKKDKHFIIQASAQAQRATDYILNITPEEKDLGVHLANHDLNENFVRREKELNSVREKGKIKITERGVGK